MQELVQLAEGCGYLPGGVNAGVVWAPDGRAVAVDTGGDREAGRNLLRAVQARGLRLVAVVNTHSHADHYGGNDYLLRQVPHLEVWAPVFEEAVLRNPYLEPFYLYGARPPEALQNKWLMAKPSAVHHVYPTGDGELQVAGLVLRVHRADGHATRQAAVGFGPVCYAADSFFGPEVLEKYEVPFTHDVAGQLDTLERLRGWPYEWFVPGHGAPVGRPDLARVLDANVRAVRQATERVRRAVGSGATADEVVHRVAEQLRLPPTNPSTYFLLRATVMAHLTYLLEAGQLSWVLDRGALRWLPAAD
ncbi:MAG: MBL fold metallo-hydrolase [Armatimonadota bacterium]|nr:MBL fold metallo-hydrolase [Armatimonadota bacterium]MDR7412567.1 MBL fold metallo-hydrolase [Armatimonadota bacterium]MDR7429662.1 MBL fold metallo-hydrolase [Armatimonadota bacterium]MDR7432415.1 MBL fold metallo-hydrolase [Armatimonadota bacterium]MDR7477170.1 MBL fold metallo-hydrolase [Armatimonadota bacterium]